MLKLDRCLEERCRLGVEADNLCRWFGRELHAIELSLRTPSISLLYIHLELPLTKSFVDDCFKVQLQQSLLLLKSQWSNSLVSVLRFDSHIA